MSDEATPYYEDVVDQMTIGLRWLKETLDVVPSVAWHIDPFGHQASSASMFSKMGFNSFFFARIDYQDKQLRMSEKKLEMVWRPTTAVEDKSNYIFTHVNYYHYSPPPGFCFDLVCRDEPIKDDPTLEDYNIQTKSQALVDYFKSQAQHFRTTNLLHTLGEDFHYANARMWYKNFDKLLKYINSRPEFGVKIQYSTPSLYINAIQGEGQTYPGKTDDFFPYADHQNAYWTGYFTSRVAVKGFVRDFGRWLQATRKYISELKISDASSVVKDNSKNLETGIWDL